MKKFFRNSLAALAATVAAVAVLTSCGKSADSASVVPADAKYAVKINLQIPLENAGITVGEDGSITLPESMTQGNPMAASMAKMASQYVAPFNMSEIVVFEAPKTDIIAVVGLRDADKAAAEFEKYLGEPKTDDGFKVFNLGGNGVAAIKDSRVYFADELDDVKTAIKSAEKESLEKYPAIHEWFSSDAAVAAIASPKELELPANMAEYWLCGTATVKGQSATGEMVLMNADGKRFPFGESFSEVSTDFLRYLPKDANTVMALGKIDSPEINSMISMVAAQMGEYGDLLTSINGTMSLAFGVSPDFNGVAFMNGIQNGHVDLDAFKQFGITAMVAYPQAAVDKLISLANTQFKAAGVATTTDGTITTASPDGVPVFYGAADNYFICGIGDVASAADPGFAPMVEGTRGVIASITAPGANQYGFTWGSEGRLWLTSDAVKFEATVTNTSKNFLEVVVEAFQNPKLQQQMMQAVEEAVEMTPYGNSSYGKYL